MNRYDRFVPGEYGDGYGYKESELQRLLDQEQSTAFAKKVDSREKDESPDTEAIGFKELRDGEMASQ